MFWPNKKNHFKKSQTYLPKNNQFIAKVTFKGYVRCISILFSMSKNSLFKTKKQMLFIIFQRLFSFLRYSNLRILESNASRPSQMLKYETRKCILLNNLGRKHSLVIKFGQFMWYYKRKTFIKIFNKNVGLQTPSQVHIYIWTRNLTIIDLISFIDLICNFI